MKIIAFDRYLRHLQICCGTSSKNMKRVCIYPKDVSLLTGKSIRHAQLTLQNMRIVLKKQKRQYITMNEFADFSGIELQEIEKFCFSLAMLFYLILD